MPENVQAPVKSIDVSTEKTDYFIGELVTAKLVIGYTGLDPLLPVTFEWFTPGNVTIFNETKDLVLYKIGNDLYGAAYSNWTSNMTGTNFRIKGSHDDGNEVRFVEPYFNVWNYSEAVYVDSLTVSLSSNFYENNTVARATTALDYLGNGTFLENVSFVWNYPNGTEAFNQSVLPVNNQTNSSVEVYSNWTVDFVGTGYEVTATYEGVAPLSDTAFFDVIPRRVNTWKNQSISGDEEWTLIESPFGVCSNITVQIGAKLTVPAGSTIRFCPDASLTVRGTLVMEAFPTSNITLTSYSYPPSRGDWKGVFFEDETNDTSSVLSHVKVNYSQQGIVLNSASPNLANITISNSSVSGMEIYQSVASLFGIVIIDSDQGVYAFESTLNMMDSEVLRCSDGVVAKDSNGTLEGNQIYSNNRRGIWAQRSSLVVRNSYISDISETGIILESTQDFLVEGSTINGDINAFWTTLSTNLTVSRSTISSGILSFSTTDDVLVVNSTITSSPENFRVWGGSIVTALNCSFDDSLVWVSSGSWLYVDNFLDVGVVDVGGPALAGASVAVIVDQVPMAPRVTGADGWARWLVVRYEAFDGPNVMMTFVQANVSLEGYNITNNLRTVNMSMSHSEVFEGYPTFIPGDDDGVPYSSLMMGIIIAVIAVLAVLLIAFFAKRRKKRREEPVAEAEAPEGPFEFEPEEGKGYIFADEGRDRGFEVFVSEMGKGTKGICFTRTFPPSLKKQYELLDAKILWLSRDEEKGGFIPTNLGAISNVVEKFLKENKKDGTIVMIDGLEYLVAQNGFGKVLKLLHSLKDSVGVGGSTLLVPFNLQSVSDREGAMLKGDFEVVE